jgi:hypothetical protein
MLFVLAVLALLFFNIYINTPGPYDRRDDALKKPSTKQHA